VATVVQNTVTLEEDTFLQRFLREVELKTVFTCDENDGCRSTYVLDADDYDKAKRRKQWGFRTECPVCYHEVNQMWTPTEEEKKHKERKQRLLVGLILIGVSVAVVLIYQFAFSWL
jgi:hypothetical protein